MRGSSALDRVEKHGDVERLQMAHAVAGRALYWTSVYRVGDVLVDSGCARGRATLQRFLARGRAPVTTVLTTHEHEDHVGNHACLRGCEIFAPARAVEILDAGPPPLPFYRWITWGAHEKAPGVAQRVGDAVTTSGRRFRVLPTPGHSNDHVVYLDEDASAVYTGAAWFGKLRAVREKEDVPLQMESLRRIAALDPAVLYPTHGAILERPRNDLLDVADHFDALATKARRLHERGLSTRRIRRELLGAEPGLYWVSQGAFSAENIVKSVLR